jgi:hypothetical protein
MGPKVGLDAVETKMSTLIGRSGYSVVTILTELFGSELSKRSR